MPTKKSSPKTKPVKAGFSPKPAASRKIKTLGGNPSPSPSKSPHTQGLVFKPVVRKKSAKASAASRKR